MTTYYVLFYKTVDNYVERRALFRTMAMAGAFDEPADGAALDTALLQLKE